MEEIFFEWLEYECALPFAWPDVDEPEEDDENCILQISIEIEVEDDDE